MFLAKNLRKLDFIKELRVKSKIFGILAIIFENFLFPQGITYEIENFWKFFGIFEFIFEMFDLLKELRLKKIIWEKLIKT